MEKGEPNKQIKCEEQKHADRHAKRQMASMMC